MGKHLEVRFWVLVNPLNNADYSVVVLTSNRSNEIQTTSSGSSPTESNSTSVQLSKTLLYCVDLSVHVYLYIYIGYSSILNALPASLGVSCL